MSSRYRLKRPTRPVCSDYFYFLCDICHNHQRTIITWMDDFCLWHFPIAPSKEENQSMPKYVPFAPESPGWGSWVASAETFSIPPPLSIPSPLPDTHTLKTHTVTRRVTQLLLIQGRQIKGRRGMPSLCVAVEHSEWHMTDASLRWSPLHWLHPADGLHLWLLLHSSHS